MKYKQIPVGPIQANCYLIYNENKQCLIIDPGAEGERLQKIITKNELKPVAVLLTHAHYDHIGALEYIRNAYQIPVYIHRNEQDWLLEPSLNASKYSPYTESIAGKEADFFFEHDDEITVGDFTFLVLETPGHSPGSVTFYFKEQEWAFVGDALFHQSIGRTDLTGGSQRVLLESIHTKLLTLPEETVVLSGHGQATTIGAEMDHNPFLNGY